MYGVMADGRACWSRWVSLDEALTHARQMLLDAPELVEWLTVAEIDRGGRPISSPVTLPAPTPASLEGHRRRRWRRYTGLDIEAFAARVGVSPALVRTWEEGVATPDHREQERVDAAIEADAKPVDPLDLTRQINDAVIPIELKPI